MKNENCDGCKRIGYRATCYDALNDDESCPCTLCIVKTTCGISCDKWIYWWNKNAGTPYKTYVISPST